MDALSSSFSFANTTITTTSPRLFLHVVSLSHHPPPKPILSFTPYSSSPPSLISCVRTEDKPSTQTNTSNKPLYTYDKLKQPMHSAVASPVHKKLSLSQHNNNNNKNDASSSSSSSSSSSFKLQTQRQNQHSPTTTTYNNIINASKSNATLFNNNTTSPIVVASTPTLNNIAATMCNALDHLINNFIDPPVLRPFVDPRNVLSENFYPVTELPPTPCPIVRGTIPPCLAGGAYIRNGPNPQYLPRGPHHLFDGDGMLHSLLLPPFSSSDVDDDATACMLSSRFVHTYKYLVERDAGASIIPNAFSGFHGVGGIARGAVTAARVLTGQMNLAEGVGLANTSLVFFAGQLYALAESDLPYALHLNLLNGDISTMGRSDFQGQLFIGMTAHPKKDPLTGEMFAFRYGPVPPYVTYFRFDKQGHKMGPDVPIFSVSQPSFLHDFAITENYAIFPEIQIVMQPMEMMLRGGSPVGADRGKVPRLGLLPRYAESESEMRWFEVPGFNIIHSLNAWEEEGGNVVVIVAPNVLSVEHALEQMELVHSSMEMLRIDLRTGTVSRTPLSARNMDFGVIHPGYVGRKNRYGYLGIGDPMPKITGVAKLDFHKVGKDDCVVAKRDFGPGCFGGEPFFVPANANNCSGSSMKQADEEEDRGYLVTYVHNERRGESRFLVMDTQSPDLEIVADVLLPRRVPYGFHGLFVTQQELRSQYLN